VSRKKNSCATGNEWPDNERPREWILGHGAGALSDVQLLAMRKTESSDKGVVELAIAFLYAHENLLNMDCALGANRASIKGVEAAKIAQGKAVFEAQSNDSTPIFFSSSAIHSYCAPKYNNLKKEHSPCLFRDAQNRFIRDGQISEGTPTNPFSHHHQAFKEAIRASAVSVIFVHNHPSGKPTPSPDNIVLTEKRKQSGDVIGIAALGHIIICDVHT